jgi:hypothetical protein
MVAHPETFPPDNPRRPHRRVPCGHQGFTISCEHGAPHRQFSGPRQRRHVERTQDNGLHRRIRLEPILVRSLLSDSSFILYDFHAARSSIAAVVSMRSVKRAICVCCHERNDSIASGSQLVHPGSSPTDFGSTPVTFNVIPAPLLVCGSRTNQCGRPLQRRREDCGCCRHTIWSFQQRAILGSTNRDLPRSIHKHPEWRWPGRDP